MFKVFQKYRIQRRFQSYVDPELVKKVIEGKVEPVVLPEPSPVYFAMAQVADKTLPDLVKHVEILLSHTHGPGFKNISVLPVVFSSIVSVGFLSRSPLNEIEKRRDELVNLWLQSLGDNVRIVYGNTRGHVGVLSHREPLFGLAFPKVEQVFQSLFTTPMGKATRVDLI